MGVVVCDGLNDNRQVSIIRTKKDGSSTENESSESASELGAFTLVNASRSSNSSAAQDASRLQFGQPVLLRHVVSGRYLCTGLIDEAKRTITSVPAEIARENEKMSLLPSSFIRDQGFPEDAFVSACTFRFLPTRNHGRAAVFTGDPLFLASASKRLVRAGLQPLSETTEADVSVSTADRAAKAIFNRTLSNFDEDQVYGTSARRISLRPPTNAASAVDEDEQFPVLEKTSTPFDE